MWKLFVILFLSSVIGNQTFDKRPPELVELEESQSSDGQQVLKLWGSIYHAHSSQCDNTPFITANGSRIDPNDPGKHRYVALSRDLIRPFVTNHELYGYNPEARFQFGDTILVQGTGKLDGHWIIVDSMNKRYQNRIDFLVDYSIKGYDFPDSVTICSL